MGLLFATSKKYDKVFIHPIIDIGHGNGVGKTIYLTFGIFTAKGPFIYNVTGGLGNLWGSLQKYLSIRGG